MRGETGSDGYPVRRALVFGVFALATAVLLWRLLDLQFHRKAFFRDQGEARHLRVVTTPADRGTLRDRNGDPLAMSTPVESVWVNPKELAPDRVGELASQLDVDALRLAATLEARASKEFVYVRRHLPPPVAERVRALELPGVHLQREYRRYYPQGEVTAHVVGFTDVDDRGQEGLELAYEHTLRGEPGAKRVLRDRLGRVVEDVELIRSPHPGADLTLSLDRRVQYLAYRALLAGVTRNRARAGSAVVLDARTGEVLAMVNQPAYNPNRRAERVGSRYRNRAVTDVFEPGSTIKPFTIAAALESGRFRHDTPVDTTPGRMKVGSHTVRDLRNYGVIDVSTIITKSSNVGASKLALAMDAEELWRTLHRVGLGEKTTSDFPGESDGVLTHFGRWGQIHRVTLSYGYGLSVTALQLARAYAVLANGGRLPQISFLKVDEPDPWVRVMSAETARAVRDMLATVPGPEGTARRARVAGYRVGGKTGTAKKSVRGGYAKDRYLSLFAGMAPMSDPRLVAVVTIDEPRTGDYYGGLVAAPVFSEIMAGALRLLGLPPDDRDEATRQVALGAAPGELPDPRRRQVQ